MNPVLIVTCRAGSEDWCEEEIGNVLFPHDPELKVVKTKYPGLLIVYSKLDPLKAYTISLSSEYGFVEKIIPVQIHDKFNIDALDKILNIVGYGEKLKVKLRVRGRRGLSTIIWKKIMDLLKRKNSKHDPSSNICLYVEVIDDYFYVGRVKC
ncbi:MAG: hypothetical protein J7L82_04735 [Staphylothermus sp.]|nr:hypothetical protein [Staphylothermus sp.]